jgi:O-antigen/teichoic acid export membrane protein
MPNSLRQHLFYALGIVIMKGVSFFMLPFIAHHLSPDDFGRLEILTSLGALGGIVVGFGLLNTMFRFAGSAKNASARQRLVAESFGLNLIIGGITLTSGLLLADPITNLLPAQVDSSLVRLTVLLVALEGCIAIPLGWLRMEEKAGIFFSLNTGKAILQALLVLLFLQQGRGIAGILEAGAIASAFLSIALVSLQIRSTGVRFRPFSQRQMIRYSLPLVGSGLLGFALTGLDRWVLADIVGPAEMAQYAIAAKFAMLTALLLQPYLMWWSPRRFSILREQDGNIKAARYAAAGSAISLLIVVAVGLTAPLLVGLMFPPEYHTAMHYLPWLVLVMAIKDSAELLNLGCYTGKTTNLQLLINLAGGITGIVGMLAMVPLWGAWGAVGALAAAQVVRLLLYLGVSQRLLPLPYPTRGLVALSVLTLTLLWLGELVDNHLTRALLALHGIALMGIAAVALRLLPFRPLKAGT